MCNERDERRVKGLKVKCPNWEKGCRWQGDLGDTAQLTGTKCQLQTALCLIGCKEDICRNMVKPVLKRAYKCPQCHFADVFAIVSTTHLTLL